MRPLFKNLALTFIGIILVSVSSIAQTRGSLPAMTEQQLAGLMERLSKISERHATFREEKNLAALERPLISIGRLHYRSPRILEKITSSPKSERLAVDGDHLTITMGPEPSRVLDLSAQPELQALVDTIRGTLSGDLKLLRTYYVVRGEGTSSAWRLMLTPSDSRVARFVRVVIVEGANADPATITTIQTNGDEQRLTIEPLR